MPSDKTAAVRAPKTISNTRAGKAAAAGAAARDESAIFDIGEVLRRVRLQRQLSVREVAEGCGLSQSFLSMVERGDSDISLGRLAKLASFYEHDIGSLLGYSTRISKPRYIKKGERKRINRGPGVSYENIFIPVLEIELNLMRFQPKSGFSDAISHEGFDVLYVVKGEVVLCLADEEYVMSEGDCLYHSAAYRHRIVNRTGREAFVVGLTSGQMS